MPRTDRACRRNRPGRRAPAWGAGVLACLAGLSMAHAQSKDDPPAGTRRAIYADFGFGGQFRSEHWGPITVYVDAGDTAFGGVVAAEFVQDATQSARIITPFAATPGRQTPVQIVAALPALCNRVTVTMIPDDGQRPTTLTYAAAPREREALLPPLLDPANGLVVTAGRASLNEAIRVWTRQGSGAAPGRRVMERPEHVFQPRASAPVLEEEAVQGSWRRVSGAAIQPEAMPLSAMAYDGVVQLVVGADAAAAADPRAVVAVREWVANGGRLAIVADAPGPSWRVWLPDGPAGDLIDLDAPRTGPLPAEVAGVVREEGRRQRDLLPGEDPGTSQPEEAVPPPAQTATFRTMSLTGRGADEGWIVRWSTDDPLRGALAEGPVGFGWVTILGIEPRSASQTISARAAGAVWRHALTPGVRDWLEAVAWRAQAGGSHWMRHPAGDAIMPALERIGRVPTAGDALFFAIAGAMVLLALLVGPVDYFVLRRVHSAQRSWVTALFWIGAASAAAYAMPFTVRSGPTQVNRVAVMDAFSGSPWSARAALTGVYAGQAGRATVRDPDQTSWWRGISPVFYGGEGGLKSVVTFVQDAAGAAAGASRGNPLEQLGLGIWTFRAFVDRAIASNTLSASLERTGGGWSVRILGLPEGATISDGALRIGDSWWLVRSPPAPAPDDQNLPPIRGYTPPRSPIEQEPLARFEDGAWTIQFAAEAAEPPDTWRPPGRTDFELLNPGALVEVDRPGLVLDLPGANRRGLSVARRVRSGRWAALYLAVEELPPDVRINWESRYQQSTVVRLMIPLAPREGDS